LRVPMAVTQQRKTLRTQTVLGSSAAREISNVIDPQVPNTTLRYANPVGFAKHLTVSQYKMRSHRDSPNVGLATTWHRGLAHKLADGIRPA
jgi:hypothetical protein